MGDSFLPLDQQWDSALTKGGHLRKIVLPPETFDDAEDFLRLTGVDAFSFFPDLQGLGLKNKARVESDIRFARRKDPRLFKGPSGMSTWPRKRYLARAAGMPSGRRETIYSNIKTISASDLPPVAR
jgi:hypothetical protein